MNRLQFFDLIIHGLIAFMGGVVKIITEGKELVMQSLTSFFAGGVIGVFAGMVTYFVCKHFELGEYLTVAFTGLAGYMGTPLLEVFSTIMKRTILGLFRFKSLNGSDKKE